jgi:hypothetical protein
VQSLANANVSGSKDKERNTGKMKAHWCAVFCAFFVFVGLGLSDLQAQQSAFQPSVLHIVQSQTTSQTTPQTGVPTYLAMYHVLNGAKSPVELLALTGPSR